VIYQQTSMTLEHYYNHEQAEAAERPCANAGDYPEPPVVESLLTESTMGEDEGGQESVNHLKA
jgi:hypothetical protein